MPVTVFVSQYTRQIAHELDDLRSVWLNRRSNDSVIGTLPPEIKMALPPDLNHAEFLGDKDNLHTHYADAVRDARLVESYFHQLCRDKKEKRFRIHGRIVTHAEFEEHRRLILGQKDYLLNISLRLRMQEKRHNIMHGAISRLDAADFNGMPVPEDVQIIRHLSQIIRMANRQKEHFTIDEEVSYWLKQAEGYMGKAVQDYLVCSPELYDDSVVDPTSKPHRSRQEQGV